MDSAEEASTAVGGGARLGALPLGMLDNAPVGIAVVHGPDHRLLYVNAAYRAMFGSRPLGRPFLQTFGDLAQSGYDLLTGQVMDTGEPAVLAEAPITVDYPDTGRQERYFSISIFPVTMEDGAPAVLSMMLDVTDRVDAAQRRQALQRYSTLVRAGALVEWTASPADGSVRWSRGWQEITGQQPEEYLGHGWLDAVAPDDRPGLEAAWVTAVTQDTDLFEHTFRVRMHDGTYRRFHVHAVPVREDGTVVEWTGICTDVERRWREQRRGDLSTRASAAISDATRIDDVLTALVRVVVPELADACAAHLVPGTEVGGTGPRSDVERVAWTGREDLALTPPPPPWNRSAARDVFARPVHRTFPPGRPPADLFPSDTVRWLRANRVNSVVVAPLTVEGSVAAVLTAAVCGEREPLDRDDVALLTGMLDRIQPVVDAVAEFQRTKHVASALQHSLLGRLPEVPGLCLAGRYRSSPTSAEVGGDWYDAFTVDGAVMLAIGDIAGHDLAAAIAMSQLRNMLRAFAVDRPQDPQEVLRRLDSAVARSGEYQGTATSVLARVEPGPDDSWRVTYSVAGHPPPLLVLPDGDTRFLEEAHDPLLGLDPGAPRSSAVEPLPPGATLLLYTDGLVEHASEPLDTGLDRLARHCAAMADTPLDRFCDRLLTELPVAGNDDITLIALRPAP